MKSIVFSIFLIVIVIVIHQTSPMALDYINQFKNNPFQQSAVPRQSDYHIGSRLKLNKTNQDQSDDPAIKLFPQKGSNSNNQILETKISLLPWEEDSWQYFTTTTIKSIISSQPSTINQPTSSTNSPTTIKQITSSSLPWEEDYLYNYTPNQVIKIDFYTNPIN